MSYYGRDIIDCHAVAKPGRRFSLVWTRLMSYKNSYVLTTTSLISVVTPEENSARAQRPYWVVKGIERNPQHGCVHGVIGIGVGVFPFVLFPRVPRSPLPLSSSSISV